MANTIIIYAPQGAGKNLHASALAEHYGCSHIVDEFWAGQTLVLGGLHLTSDDAFDGTKFYRRSSSSVVGRVVPLNQALRYAGLDDSLHELQQIASKSHAAHADLIAACKAIDADVASTGTVTPESVDKVREALAKAGAA